MISLTYNIILSSSLQIYMINLARRPDRRKRMLMSLEELGLYSNEQDAVDGRYIEYYVIDAMTLLRFDKDLRSYDHFMTKCNQI